MLVKYKIETGKKQLLMKSIKFYYYKRFLNMKAEGNEVASPTSFTGIKDFYFSAIAINVKIFNTDVGNG